MKKLWQEFEKLFGVYRWHPKIALRYLPVVKEIKKIFPEQIDILEVGSGGLGITPYIRQPVVGVDLDFAPPIHPQLIPVIASALKLPFTDNSFSVVVSLDMLEHLPKEGRPQAIAEILRVGHKLVCFGVPCGKLAQAQDEKLRQEYRTLRGREFSFLKEQVEYGLPEVGELRRLIRQQAKALGKKIKLKDYGNLNLSVRLFLMRGWLSQNPLVNFMFRKVFLILIPFFRRANHEPTYRRIFAVEII